jgi:ATP-dependent DNA helicase RecG
MNDVKDEMDILLQQGESDSVEFKETLDNEALESVAAFANTKGGTLLIGKSNRQMTDDDLTRAVLEKVGITWDEIAEPRATLDDLDPGQLRRFRTLCNQKGRRALPPDEDDKTVLEKLNLLHEGKLTRAAVLLFGKEPQRFYTQAKVKIGRFRSATFIVDDREVAGSLFDQVENTMGYFREHLQTRFVMNGEPSREVIWEYPLLALREAVTNAVCHRDYLDNGHTQIRWHDDNVIFLNPGGLPSPLRVEELKRGHRSVPRNRKIAEMFFYAGLIEQWGSGTLAIVSECLSAGLPEPQFEEKQGGLWLTVQRHLMTEAHLRTLGLNERQIAAVRYVREKGKITNGEYQKLNSVSRQTATNELSDLKAKNILKAVGGKGTGKKGVYYVIS